MNTTKVNVSLIINLRFNVKYIINDFVKFCLLLHNMFWIHHSKWLDFLFQEFSLSQWVGHIKQFQPSPYWHCGLLLPTSINTLSSTLSYNSYRSYVVVAKLEASKLLQSKFLHILSQYHFYLHFPQPKIIVTRKFLDVLFGTCGSNLTNLSIFPTVGATCCEIEPFVKANKTKEVKQVTMETNS